MTAMYDEVDEPLDRADGHDRYVPTGAKDLMSAGHEGVYEWVAENLVKPGMRVLDFGCGTGYGAAILRAAGAEVTGADSSATAIAHAMATYPGIPFEVADLTAALPLQWRASYYDLVVSSEVIEHVDDPFAFIDNIARSLTLDGTGFIGTPNRLWTKAHMPAGRLMSDSHVMEFTAPALLGLLRTRFREVDLMLRAFPAWANPWSNEEPLEPLPQRKKPLDPPRQWIKTLARRTMPNVYSRLATRVNGNSTGVHGSANAPDVTPSDICWVAPDDPRATDGAGLAAICRCPIR